MATWEQAEQTFTLSRKFFSAKDMALKSTNKAYANERGEIGDAQIEKLAGAKNISEDAATVIVLRRGNARLEAKARGKYENELPGKTPVGYGKLVVERGSDTGNCGVMACVAMWYARTVGVAAANMWLVTVTNEKTKRTDPVAGKLRMKFGHSYALLGGPGKKYIVDPWAGIICLESEYKEMMKAKMEKWHQQGKRIMVNWSNGDYEWANATDKTVLSLLSSSATTEKTPGDQVLQNV
jgi:hypothetical protein